jgi:hypothetical protein
MMTLRRVVVGGSQWRRTTFHHDAQRLGEGGRMRQKRRLREQVVGFRFVGDGNATGA